MQNLQIIYSVDVPFSVDSVIEVYCESGMGSYEWRVVREGKSEFDTKNAAYGCAGIALRDALIQITEETYHV